MTYPTHKGEREEALGQARGIVKHAGQITGLLIDETHLLLARALLSSSKAEGEMREALAEFIAWADRNDWGTVPKALEAKMRAKLTPKDGA